MSDTPSTDLQTAGTGALERPATVVNPATGEVFELETATASAVAAELEDIKDLASRLTEYRATIAREVLARMDSEGKWTVDVGSKQLVGAAPGGKDYDPETLYEHLLPLVREGKVGVGAANEAVKLDVKKKVSKKGLNALAKLAAQTPELAQAIKAAELPRPDSSRSIALKAKPKS